jgi:lipid II:glycine glycyltransferase (peptidoglycan interpeptide bridge formation enzyme)
MDIEKITNQNTWDTFVKQNHGHPLQLWGWSEVKKSHGWRSKHVFLKKHNEIIAAAQILIKPLPKPFPPLFYIPRGPVVSHEKYFLETLKSLVVFSKNQSALTLKIESDQKNTAFSLPKSAKYTKNSILLSHTAQIDLTKSEEEIKSDFSKKTRQYINKSAKDVEVKRLDNPTTKEIQKILKIYKETATRANFALHDDKYYENIAKSLGENSQIFVAYQKSTTTPLAFLWLAVTPEIAFELYGGMTELGSSLRANYILKNTAIFWAKSQKIQIYDLNGLLNDGVSNFKRGFVPEETNLIPAFDFPLSPLFPIWETLLPAVKKIVQTLRKTQNQIIRKSKKP